MANPRTVARVASRIKERVAYCLQFEMRDPRATFITVTDVELSKDLRHAKVSYSTLEGGGERTRVQHMLEDATGFVRHQLGRVLETREVPTIRWMFDDSIERAAELDLLIRAARQRDEEIRGEHRAEHGAEGAELEDAGEDPDPDQGQDEGPDAADATDRQARSDGPR